MPVTKTTYPTTGKIVLEKDGTGIMISDDLYEDLTGTFGLSDEQLFNEMVI